MRLRRNLIRLVGMVLMLFGDVLRFFLLCLRPNPTLAAENLFLRKQLVLYQERQVKPRRATNTTRIAMIWLSRWFDWRQALAVVQPATLTRWHCQGFRLFWQWKSRPGRPPLPAELQVLIHRMARDNPSWGQERIANEILLKLGLRVSPRTVRKYLPNRPEHRLPARGHAGRHRHPRARDVNRGGVGDAPVTPCIRWMSACGSTGLTSGKPAIRRVGSSSRFSEAGTAHYCAESHVGRGRGGDQSDPE
jgi:hypothetical protein